MHCQDGRLRQIGEFDHDEVIRHIVLENEEFIELKCLIYEGWRNKKNVKDEFYVYDKIIRRSNRIVVLDKLRNNLLQADDNSHQGITPD